MLPVDFIFFEYHVFSLHIILVLVLISMIIIIILMIVWVYFSLAWEPVKLMDDVKKKKGKEKNQDTINQHPKLSMS